MGKKPQRFTWPEAKKRCRLNQLDISMAKRLGFSPDALVHAIPSPQQKWKLPVKYWIHELHRKKFGHVPGERELVYKPPPPLTPEEEAEAARRFEEEMYWDDYWERNADEPKAKRERASKPAPAPAGKPVDQSEWLIVVDSDDDKDCPF
jgi:hypothetical protein